MKGDLMDIRLVAASPVFVSRDVKKLLERQPSKTLETLNEWLNKVQSHVELLASENGSIGEGFYTEPFKVLGKIQAWVYAIAPENRETETVQYVVRIAMNHEMHKETLFHEVHLPKDMAQ